MANNTVEFWSVNGISLHQFGWSVTTLSGTRYALPTKRGENTPYAYIPGSSHRIKVDEERVISLQMFMTGSDPATGIPGSNPVQKWNDNWDTLRRLVYSPTGSQVTLTRRTLLTNWLGSGTPLLTVDALAEMTGTMEPTMTGRTRAEFVLDFTLADPYFYGGSETQNLTKDIISPVVNTGHVVAKARHMSIDLIGPLTNPTVTNLSTSPVTSVTFTGTIGSGSTLTINVSQFQALLAPANTNQIAKISHSGNRNWFALYPGNNNIRLTATSGTGSGVLRWRAPYV